MKNAIVIPINMARRDNLKVTVLYFSIIGITLNINSKSNFTTITYSPI